MRNIIFNTIYLSSHFAANCAFLPPKWLANRRPRRWWKRQNGFGNCCLVAIEVLYVFRLASQSLTILSFAATTKQSNFYWVIMLPVTVTVTRRRANFFLSKIIDGFACYDFDTLNNNLKWVEKKIRAELSLKKFICILVDCFSFPSISRVSVLLHTPSRFNNCFSIVINHFYVRKSISEVK